MMTSPKKLLDLRKIYAKKRLGQHFLNDPSTAEMIVAHSGISASDIVLELGAGLGALTTVLARTAKTVYAVEIDPQIINLLKAELCSNNIDNVVLIEKDILKVDIEKLSNQANRKIIVIGNLPYNISSQALIQLIKFRNGISKAVLMFQKELAQRITAQPKCRSYGRLTVMLRYCADIKTLAHIKSSVFFPKPMVDSQVLEIKFKNDFKHLIDDEAFFFKVIKAAFCQKRKMLRNALAGSEFHLDSKIAKRALEKANIDPCARGEALDVSDFIRLNNSLQSQILGNH